MLCVSRWLGCDTLLLHGPPTLGRRLIPTNPHCPCSLDQPADAPVTVLSLGRSLLKETVDVTLPLRPTAPLGEHGGHDTLAHGARCCYGCCAGVCSCTNSWESACALPQLLLTAPPPHRPCLRPHSADAAGVAVAAASADLAPLRAYLAAARCADFGIAPDMEQFLQQGEPHHTAAGLEAA